MNLNVAHPGAENLLRNNGISDRRSQGGIISFSRKYIAYYRWCITRHYCTKLVEARLFLADKFVCKRIFGLHKSIAAKQPQAG